MRLLQLLCTVIAVTVYSCPGPSCPLRPAVVLVTTFPGEYTRWHERLPLGEDLPFPAGASGEPLGWNATLGVLGVVTGMGPRRASSSITALGLDPRLDLRSSYWLLAGIAGIDPAHASAGSAVWAQHLVDGDVARFIDAREIPAAWPAGWVPRYRQSPYGAPPAAWEAKDVVYRLDTELVHWAFDQTKAIHLPDSEALKKLREPFAGSVPGALQPPRVLLGASLATGRFWDGRLSTEWARNWTSFWTRGEGDFAVSQMEDTGVALALNGLHRAGKTQVMEKAFLVLRTASNFVMPPPGVSAADYIKDGEVDEAYQAACEAAFLVGEPVVRLLASRPMDRGIIVA